MKYGYARVSTVGRNLEAQIEMLEKENCDIIFQDKFTGTQKNRPEFDKMMNKIKTGDTIVITKLDRFARNTRQALELIEEMFGRGVKIYILNMGIIENTATGKLIYSVFSAFPEFERDMIVQRTQEGKQLAKRNPDYREGRPKKFSKEQINNALELLEAKTTKEVSRMTGISEATLYREKRKCFQS